MNKKQLWIIYIVLCILTIWGWDLINVIKLQRTIDWSQTFSVFHVSQLIYILITFWLTRFLLKKYYPSKQYLKLFLSLLFLIGQFILLRFLIEEKLYPLLFGYGNYPESVGPLYYALDNIYYAIVYIVLGSLVFLLDHQISTQNKQVVLQQETVKAELAFLRTQVSPHFLFNSLNNIYSLSYKKSDKAPDAILKLSELIRYLLYEKQEEIVVEKEWLYIENFISLQQLRYDKPLALEITKEGDLNAFKIAPYLLIPFVENAFKHGAVQDEEHPMLINLQCQANELIFKMKNKISSAQKDKDGGIGLENVKRRLHLLYAANYKLSIQNKNNYFEVELRLQK